jgi:hypothetical protein
MLRKIKESYLDGIPDDDSDKLFEVIKHDLEIIEEHRELDRLDILLNFELEYRTRKSIISEMKDLYAYWKPIIGETNPLCIRISGIIRKLKSS